MSTGTNNPPLTAPKKRGSDHIPAAFLHGARDLRLGGAPDPGEPGPGQARVRIAATGLCGSDIHFYLHGRIGDAAPAGPFILGHEFAGTVEETGPEARDGFGRPLRPGARVAVDPARPCGRCVFCQEGAPNLCSDLQFCGHPPTQGSLRTVLLAPAETCWPLPTELDAEEGALLEPLGMALRALDLAEFRLGETAAVFGCGAIGLLLVQLLRLAGAQEVWAADPLPWRLALAEAFGARPAAGKDVATGEQIAREAGDGGVRLAIEAAWAGEAVEAAARALRPGGRLVLAGIPPDDALSFSSHGLLRRKELTLRLCRRMRRAYPRALALAASGRIDLKRLISHRLPLKRAPEAFALNAAYAENVVKVIIES